MEAWRPGLQEKALETPEKRLKELRSKSKKEDRGSWPLPEE